MSDQLDIEHQLALLREHRRRLAADLKRFRLQGGSAYADPVVVNGIADERESIRSTKATLRERGVRCDDEPGDELLPEELPRVPFMVEALPPDFVPRPTEFEGLVAQLLDTQRGAVAITAALRGAGGYGKTTLARALCHDQRVRTAFPDGILWVTLGENPGDLTGRVEDLIEMLTRERPRFAGVEAAAALLDETLGDRDVLLVVDDVWNPAHLKPFLQGGPCCARLITTRDSATLPHGASTMDVDAMRQDEAIALLSAGLPTGQADNLRQLAARLGEWPLLLKLVNGVLRDTVGAGKSLLNALSSVTRRLDKRGLIAFDAEDETSRNRAVALTIEVSLERLRSQRARYDELAIFPEDVSIPLATLARLWNATSDLDEDETEALCLRLSQLSLLLSCDLRARTIRLHDIVRAYLARTLGERLPTIHGRLLDAYGLERWADLFVDEPYLWNHLAYHLSGAGRGEELRTLLLDFDWLRAKLMATDANSLLTDYEIVPATVTLSQSGELHLVQGALQLSAHILVQDKSQLAAQLIGRLLSFELTDIQTLVEQAKQWRGAPWLRPLTASLTRPGGPLVRTLAGHTDGVNAVALTPDGRQAVSASWDGTLKLWNLATGQEIRTFAGHTGRVNAVVLTPDGRQAVSAADDHTLKLWDLASGQAVRTLVGHTGGVYAVALTPDGRQAVSGSSDGTLTLWDLATGQAIRTLAGHTSGVYAVALTPDGRQAVSGSSDGTLKLWNLARGQAIRTFAGHTHWITAVALTPDCRQAVSGSIDGTLKLWDLASGQAVRTLAGHTGGVYAVALTPDGRHAVSGSSDGTLTLWNLAAGQAIHTLAGHTGEVNAVAFTPDGRQAISGSIDGTLKLWNLASGQAVRPAAGHTSRVRALALTPNGRQAVSGSSDGTLKLWDLATGQELRTLAGHTSGVYAVALTPDGRQAVYADYDGTLKLWDLTSGQELRLWDLTSGQKLRTPAGHTIRVRAVALTPDGRHAVSAYYDGMLTLWDLASGRAVRTLAGHTGEVDSVALTPDGRQAISGFSDGTLKLWDLANGRAVRTLAGHTSRVRALALTPDGRQAVSGSSDGTVKLWNLATGQEIRTLAGHTGEVKAVALTPDGRQAVSAADDSSLKLWNLVAGTCLTTFDGDGTMSACATPDGVTIIAGDAAGHVHFLRLEGVEPVNH